MESRSNSKVDYGLLHAHVHEEGEAKGKHADDQGDRNVAREDERFVSDLCRILVVVRRLVNVQVESIRPFNADKLEKVSGVAQASNRDPNLMCEAQHCHVEKQV